jgi:hypothetical protein
VDARTLEVLRECGAGEWIRFVRRNGGKPDELIWKSRNKLLTAAILSGGSFWRSNERRSVMKANLLKLFVLGVLLLGFGVSPTQAQPAGAFSPTSSMNTGRYGHTATLLQDGRVLITGGYDVAGRKYLKSAEIYDPHTGTFSVTGDMAAPRGFHAATLLPNGRVLVTSDGTAELYDPVSGSFTPTGRPVVSRGYGVTGTLLKNGKVLIAGSWTCFQYKHFPNADI